MTTMAKTRRTHFGIALEYEPVRDGALAKFEFTSYDEYWLSIVTNMILDLTCRPLPLDHIRSGASTITVLPNGHTLRMLEIDADRALITDLDTPDRIVAMFSAMSSGWVKNREAVETFVRVQVEDWRRNSRYTETDVKTTVQTIVYPHQYVLVQAFVVLA